MNQLIPNNDPVGNDYCLDCVQFEIPFILIDNGSDCFWFPEAIDDAAAERLIFAMMHGGIGEAYRVDVKLILPAASDVRETTAELHCLQSKPVRAGLIVK